MRGFQGLKLVYLDEAHRLRRRNVEDGLLVPLEDLKDFVWLASSAEADTLDPMFLRRFVRLTTTPPSVQELAEFLADRCRDFRLTATAAVLARLAAGGTHSPSDCIKVLAVAAGRSDRTVTSELVDQHLRY